MVSRCLRSHRVTRAMGVFVLCCVVSGASAQINLPGGGGIKPPAIPGLDSLFKKGLPLKYTLNLADPPTLRLVRFEPEEIADLPQIPTEFTPGFYRANFATFCLRGYTPGPNRGSAQLPGRIEGAMSGTINKLLDGFGQHNDIRQDEMQTLIWALLANAKPSNLNASQQAILARCLSPQDILLLEKGGVQFLEENVIGPMMNKVDEALRPIYEADNKMRQLVSRADAAFAELEELAVLPPSEEGNISFYERGMWAPWQNGFIRFDSSSYSNTSVQFWIPRNIGIWRDEFGRITAIRDGDQFAVVTEYDDSVPPVTGDDPHFLAFRVKQTVGWGKNESGEWERVVLDENGVMALYDPEGLTKKLKPQKIDAEALTSPWANLVCSMAPGLPNPITPTFLQEQSAAKALIEAGNKRRAAAARKQLAQEAAEGLKEFQEKVKQDESTEPDIVNYDHYKDGLDAVRDADPTARGKFLGKHGRSMVEGLGNAIRDIDGLSADDQKKRRRDPDGSNPPGSPPSVGTPPPSGGAGGVGGGKGGPGNSGGRAGTGQGGGGRSGGSSGWPWPFGGGGGASGGGKNGGGISPTNPRNQTLGISSRRL